MENLIDQPNNSILEDDTVKNAIVAVAEAMQSVAQKNKILLDTVGFTIQFKDNVFNIKIEVAQMEQDDENIFNNLRPGNETTH